MAIRTPVKQGTTSETSKKNKKKVLKGKSARQDGLDWKREDCWKRESILA